MHLFGRNQRHAQALTDFGVAPARQHRHNPMAGVAPLDLWVEAKCNDVPPAITAVILNRSVRREVRPHFSFPTNSALRFIGYTGLAMAGISHIPSANRLVFGRDYEQALRTTTTGRTAQALDRRYPHGDTAVVGLPVVPDVGASFASQRQRHPFGRRRGVRHRRSPHRLSATQTAKAAVAASRSPQAATRPTAARISRRRR